MSERRDNSFRTPETSDPDSITYYYNRSRRLERASEHARFAASLWGRGRPGFFKTMMATPALKLLFLMLVFFLLLGFAVDFFLSSRDTGRLAGYTLELKALYYEGAVLATIKRQTQDQRAVAPELLVRVRAGTAEAAATMLAGQLDLGMRLPVEPRPERVDALIEYEGRVVELTLRLD